VGIFDNNFSKIGRMIWNLEILDVHRLAELNQELRATIGIITVPAETAQEVADTMVRADIRAILNFAPVQVSVPAHVATRNVDFLRELEILSYHIDRLAPEPQDDCSSRPK
jgi:redox-sensing transcriptional repressor